jgi:hypothetical protein
MVGISLHLTPAGRDGVAKTLPGDEASQAPSIVFQPARSPAVPFDPAPVDDPGPVYDQGES